MSLRILGGRTTRIRCVRAIRPFALTRFPLSSKPTPKDSLQQMQALHKDWMTARDETTSAREDLDTKNQQYRDLSQKLAALSSDDPNYPQMQQDEVQLLQSTESMTEEVKEINGKACEKLTTFMEAIDTHFEIEREYRQYLRRMAVMAGIVCFGAGVILGKLLSKSKAQNINISQLEGLEDALRHMEMSTPQDTQPNPIAHSSADPAILAKLNEISKKLAPKAEDSYTVVHAHGSRQREEEEELEEEESTSFVSWFVSGMLFVGVLPMLMKSGGGIEEIIQKWRNRASNS